MYKTGLLLLTTPVKIIYDSLGNHLSLASKFVKNKLYVRLDLTNEYLQNPGTKNDLRILYSFITDVYSKYAVNCMNLDVRLVLTPIEISVISTSPKIDVILTDENDSESCIREYVQNCGEHLKSNIIRLQPKPSDIKADEQLPEVAKMHDNVVIGGTFDRLHNGHKILLSISALLAKKKLIVGVTDGVMLKHKVLWEMIDPIEKRMEEIRDFLTDVKSTIEYSVVPIYDIYGPTITDSNIDCIVVSEETKRGGVKVNEERLKRGMESLETVIINLAEDKHRSTFDEVKVSSSNQRRRQLGTYIKKPMEVNTNTIPLRVALIGGIQFDPEDALIASMKRQGARLIDCEDIFYQHFYKDIAALLKLDFSVTSAAHNKKVFCCNIMNKIVDAKKIEALFSGRLKTRIRDELEAVRKEDSSVVILNVPSYLNIDISDIVHQVWGVIVPEVDRVNAIKDFYHISHEEASKLLGNDILNTDIMKASHMVFCGKGDSDFISMQVERAWKSLKAVKEQ